MICWRCIAPIATRACKGIVVQRSCYPSATRLKTFKHGWAMVTITSLPISTFIPAWVHMSKWHSACRKLLPQNITTIPGIGVCMGVMILAEIGDFFRFESPDNILAYAGMSPSTYQSGQLSLSGIYSHMEKRGSLSTLPNMSAFGLRPSPLISPRSELRVSTTMLRSLMRQRN